eukprot:m.420577 g.420577  ORF g.420577 m.420577 type:complete len:775 (-) comp20189_c1_seq2:92-2416(-)
MSHSDTPFHRRDACRDVATDELFSPWGDALLEEYHERFCGRLSFHPKPFVVNCTKADSASMQALRTYLSEVHVSLTQTAPAVPLIMHQVIDHLKQWRQDHPWSILPTQSVRVWLTEIHAMLAEEDLFQAAMTYLTSVGEIVWLPETGVVALSPQFLTQHVLGRVLANSTFPSSVRFGEQELSDGCLDVALLKKAFKQDGQTVADLLCELKLAVWQPGNCELFVPSLLQFGYPGSTPAPDPGNEKCDFKHLLHPNNGWHSRHSMRHLADAWNPPASSQVLGRRLVCTSDATLFSPGLFPRVQALCWGQGCLVGDECGPTVWFNGFCLRPTRHSCVVAAMAPDRRSIEVWAWCCKGRRVGCDFGDAETESPWVTPLTAAATAAAGGAESATTAHHSDWLVALEDCHDLVDRVVSIVFRALSECCKGVSATTLALSPSHLRCLMLSETLSSAEDSRAESWQQPLSPSSSSPLPRRHGTVHQHRSSRCPMGRGTACCCVPDQWALPFGHELATVHTLVPPCHEEVCTTDASSGAAGHAAHDAGHLSSAGGTEFLASALYNSMTRTFDQVHELIGVPVIKLLVIRSNTRAHSKGIQTDLEESLIRQALQRKRSMLPAVQVIYLGHVTLTELRATLRRVRPHWIHYGGHGSSEGLELVDDDENPTPLPAGTFAEMLAPLNVHGVVLNSCHSLHFAGSIQPHVDAVVAYDAVIDDNVSLEFARVFWDAVFDGAELGICFDAGNAAASLVDHRHSFHLLPRSDEIPRRRVCTMWPREEFYVA